MVVTGRLAAVAAGAAVVVMVLLPSWVGVGSLTSLLLVLAVFDVVAAGSAGALELSRPALTTVRSGRATTVELTVVNRGPRSIRGLLWDDWPASTHAVTGSFTGLAAVVAAAVDSHTVSTGRLRPRTPHRLRLAPNSKTRLITTVTPEYRGDRAAGPVTLRLFGPLGLAGRQVRRTVPARLRVLPPFHSERILASKVKQLQHLEGRNVVTVRGQGSEFDSFREYVAGDDVRAIDWRATARATDVLVRTWRPERNRHVLMVLDTGRVGAGRIGGDLGPEQGGIGPVHSDFAGYRAGGRRPDAGLDPGPRAERAGGRMSPVDGTRLDAGIEAALLLGGLASAAGDTVDLLAYDRTVRAEVRGAGGKGLQATLLHAMATVVPTLVDTDVAGLVRSVIQRTRRRSLVVWFTSLDAALVEENLIPVLPVLAARHRVLLVSVTDPEVARTAAARDTTAQIYAAAAAENLLAERALIRERLRHLGIRVVAAAPDHLPEALADEYLELKQSGAM
jgi:uncharacterized protein (DUF58 family)